MWKHYLVTNKAPGGCSTFRHIVQHSTPIVEGKKKMIIFDKVFTSVRNHELLASLVPRQLLTDLWKLTFSVELNL